MPAGERVENLTQMPDAASGEDRHATDTLWRAIYAEFHEIALRACSAGGTRAQLQPTLVAHELFLKMFAPGVDRAERDARRRFRGSVGRAIAEAV